MLFTLRRLGAEQKPPGQERLGRLSDPDLVTLRLARIRTGGVCSFAQT
jgi:hypothetical protein